MAISAPVVLGTPSRANASGTTRTYGGVSPTAGRVLTVVAFVRKTATGAPAPDLSVAISGSATWSWVRQQVSNALNNRHTLAVFEAVAPASPGTNLTVTLTSTEAFNRVGMVVFEEAGASAGFAKVVTGNSSSTTPSLNLSGAPAASSYKIAVIAATSDSDGVAPGGSGGFTELADPADSGVDTSLQVQYRTGVTTTLCDWQGAGNASNLMIAWEAVEATSGSKVAEAKVSVGDTSYTAQSAALTAGRRHVLVVRRDQTANLIGLAVDGGTEVTTSTSGTHNAQSDTRFMGTRLVDGAPQNDAATASILYAAQYSTILTGAALTAALAVAAKVLEPAWTSPAAGAVTAKKTGTTNIDLTSYVQDRSGWGWQVGSVSAVGATAAIGTDTHTIDISSVTAAVAATVAVTLRIDNLMPSAVRASIAVGLSVTVAPDVVVGDPGWEGPKSKLAWYSGSHSDNAALEGLRKNAGSGKTRELDMVEHFGAYGSFDRYGASGAEWASTSFHTWLVGKACPSMNIAIRVFSAGPNETMPATSLAGRIRATWPAKGTLAANAWVSPRIPVGYSASITNAATQRAQAMDVWQHAADGHFDHLWDAGLRAMRQNYVVVYGLTDRRVVLRPFWESNGPFVYGTNHAIYAPSMACSSNAADAMIIKAATKRFCGVARDAWPDVLLHFCPLTGGQTAVAITEYFDPDDWDIIGPDYYDTTSIEIGPPYNNGSWDDRWNWQAARTRVGGSPFGIDTWANYVRTTGKKFGIGEWGVWATVPIGSANPNKGGGDNPTFIRKMFELFEANADIMAYEVYFNSQSAGHRLAASGSGWPNASAAYKAKYATLV